MNKLITFVVCGLFSMNTFAEFQINQHHMGSGSPDQSGMHSGFRVFDKNNYSDGIFFEPHYMPEYPTSAVIWPRVVEVDCKPFAFYIQCEGYDWSPEMGRGEYLMFRPKYSQPVKPKTRIIFKEVPQKKIKE